MNPINVQVTWSKVKVKMLVFEKILTIQYLLTRVLLKCGTENGTEWKTE